MRQACDSSWRKVEPAIFGALLQGALGREEQWALGAHYTAEADILKIDRPADDRRAMARAHRGLSHRR